MTIKGVAPQEWNIITRILNDYSDKYVFYFYGSRVKDNFRPLSDLDILVKSDEKVDLNDLQELKYRFDSSKLPYIVNFVDYLSISNEFYEMIKPDLVKF